MQIKETFNNFLDTNVFVNKYDQTRDALKSSKHGNTLYLLSLLVITSIVTTFLDFVISVMGYNNPGTYLLCNIIFYVISILLNNLIFYAFVRCVRHERLNISDLKIMIKFIGIQLVCAFSMSLVQNFLLTTGVMLFSFNAKFSVMVNLLITWFFTMMNALIAFQIYDQKKGIKNIIINAYSTVIDNWKVLLMISILFISWKFVSSLAFTDIVSTEIIKVQNINNVFHTLLYQKNYIMLRNVVLFNLVNFVVAGYFEINFLMALAYLYDSSEVIENKYR